MTKRLIQVIEYDANTEANQTKTFDTLNEAMEWVKKQRPNETLLELDTEFGFQLMTQAEIDTMSSPPYTFPPRWFEVHGCEADGTIRYMDEDEYEGFYTK
jgi:hypothetical protein